MYSASSRVQITSKKGMTTDTIITILLMQPYLWRVGRGLFPVLSHFHLKKSFNQNVGLVDLPWCIMSRDWYLAANLIMVQGFGCKGTLQTLTSLSETSCFLGSLTQQCRNQKADGRRYRPGEPARRTQYTYPGPAGPSTVSAGKFTRWSNDSRHGNRGNE